MDESAHVTGATAATVLLDVSKLFGSLAPARAMGEMLRLGYPPYILALSVQAHWCSIESVDGGGRA
eukprot:3618308-Alexandrium_andersonii.AAC.1